MLEDWGDQRHAAFDRHSAVLVGPERGPVEIVQHPVAIGPEDRHVAGRRQQRLLLGGYRRRSPAAPRESPRRNRPRRPPHAPTAARQPRSWASRLTPTKGGVGGAGQVVDVGIGRQPGHRFAAGMYRPDLAGKADLAALLDDVGAPAAAADNGDGAGPQQPVQPAHHAPRGRKRSRLMMWRWISLVPSQIRSTRASRQNRSTGKSSIRPMPPWICRVASVTRASISEA